MAGIKRSALAFVVAFAASLPGIVHAASCPSGSLLISDKDAPTHISVRGSLRILAIGSSSTRGSGASSDQHTYPHRLQQLLQQELRYIPVTVINAGVGGEEATVTSKRLESLISAEHYDLVIWQVGTNDAVKNDNLDAFKQDLVYGIAAAKRSGTPLMLMDQQWYENMRDPVRYERFVAVISEVADQLGIKLLHRYKMMKGWAHSAPNSYPSFMAPDRFHMGDLGYECLARAIVRSIKVIHD